MKSPPLRMLGSRGHGIGPSLVLAFRHTTACLQVPQLPGVGQRRTLPWCEVSVPADVGSRVRKVEQGTEQQWSSQISARVRERQKTKDMEPGRGPGSLPPYMAIPIHFTSQFQRQLGCLF